MSKIKKAVKKKKPTVHRNANAKTPFREASIVGRAWAMAIKGSSVKELTKYALKEGSNIRWLLRKLRKGVRFGWTWKIQEIDGKFKIYNAKKS